MPFVSVSDMPVHVRDAVDDDLPFLAEMLCEAAFPPGVRVRSPAKSGPIRPPV